MRSSSTSQKRWPKGLKVARMVEDISALGLRHVGYAIPTDPFRRNNSVRRGGKTESSTLYLKDEMICC